ncbi:MAG TPA: hypothetical protein VJ827_07890 [Rubrobacter sp.]|nr:hypothetical protein [Rubrobacter sp.]
MKRLNTFVAASVLAVIAVGMFAGSLIAQTTPGVYAACGPDRREIQVSDLPDVVDQDRCPVGGREIVDGGVSVIVPEPGESVFAEAMSPRGSEHLVVSNPRGDKLVLGDAGSESGAEEPGTFSTQSSGPGACSDAYRNPWNSRLYNYLRYYFNRRSTPSYLADVGAARAIQKAGNNVSGVKDGCGVPDRVPATLKYRGVTRTSVDMDAGGTCRANDHKSVVGFGDLPRGYMGNTCVWAWIEDGDDRINSADVRINKADYRWTARVTRSCRGKHDVESTMTHERGHTFGLGDVPESSHPNLTMSSRINGACQTSERSLGKGDAVGLNGKYP